MPPRLLSAVAVATTAMLFVVSCGTDGLRSDSTDDIVDAWADVVCVDDPDDPEGLPPGVADPPLDERVVLSVECVSSEDGDIDSVATLTIFDTEAAAERAAEPDYDECESSYARVAGHRWVSLLDDGVGADDLVDAGGELVCEGD